MVHLMRGAGEQTNASAPRSMPGSRANLADFFGGVRLPLQTFVPKLRAKAHVIERRVSVFERNNNPPLPCNLRGGAGDRTSFISKRTVASAPSEPLSSSPAVLAASFELRAGSQALAGAAEDGCGGKR